ncbi:MAG: efflux RND transporter periplasmic adaptor subunit [Pseudidiomarina sp.]|nr:HlyD family efflux transporter periplasmic adaptor subunit [Pseudidiomarina sp.]MDX1706830.1 efflux RND transporter periplasmic adaptor subunit [Pseudidiomarina sp.]
MIKIADTSGQDVVREAPRRTYWKFIVSALVLAVLIAVTLPVINRWAKAEVSVPQDRLRIATVVKGDLVRDLSIQGRVIAAVSPTLYSPAEGTVTYHVDAGDEVKLGQLLVSIDSPELQSRLEQEQASLDSAAVALERQHIQTRKAKLQTQRDIDMAKVTYVAAEREKRRADDAWAAQAISQIDYEKAQDDLETARLVYEHATADAALEADTQVFELQTRELEVNRQQALVANLQRQVDALNILSPVNGLVGNRELDQKNQVARNQAVLSVVDLTAFEVEIAIPETYADDLAIGMAAEINYSGQTYAAQLISISPEIRDNQVIGNVRFTDDMPPVLRQNQRLTTRVILDQKADVLSVNRGQFLESGGGRIAYVVRDGVATRTTIETGVTSLSSVEIISGLVAGDQIIVSNTEPFGDAETVRITN